MWTILDRSPVHHRTQRVDHWLLKLSGSISVSRQHLHEQQSHWTKVGQHLCLLYSRAGVLRLPPAALSQAHSHLYTSVEIQFFKSESMLQHWTVSLTSDGKFHPSLALTLDVLWVMTCWSHGLWGRDPVTYTCSNNTWWYPSSPLGSLNSLSVA